MYRKSVPPDMSLFLAGLLICCTTLVACNKPPILQPDPDLARINSILAKRKEIESKVAKPVSRDFVIEEMSAMVAEPTQGTRISSKKHFVPTKDAAWSNAAGARALKIDTLLRPELHKYPPPSGGEVGGSVSTQNGEINGSYTIAESTAHCIQDPVTKKWLAVGFSRFNNINITTASHARQVFERFSTKKPNPTQSSTFLNPDDINWAFGVNDYTKIEPYSRRKPSNANR
jgi:hypothetical protein